MYGRQGINITYIGRYYDLHVRPYDIRLGSSIESGDPGQPDNLPGCPTVLLVYGFLDGSDKSRSAMTAQSCYQRVQKINANVTFTLPEMSISKYHPPILDESTAEYLPSGPKNDTTFWWRLQSSLDWSFQTLNISTVDPCLLRADRHSYQVSNFFHGVLFGKTPLPLEALAAGSPGSKYTREQVFSHIQRFYRRYTAQYISANMRMPSSSSPNVNKKTDDNQVVDIEPIQGSFTPTIGTPRLVQHRTPKLILQIMLAFMFVCGVLGYWLGKYHELVPWNPCTIAGVMVLFAGSKVCSNADSGHDNQNTRRSNVSNVEVDIVVAGGYEMAYLNPNQREASLCDADTESRRRLIREDSTYAPHATISLQDSSPKGLAEQYDLDWRYHRFRLGWWRNGTYMGPKKPPQSASSSSTEDTGTDKAGLIRRVIITSSVNAVQSEKWRYGIDITI